jgi:Domain of unknown function (DUF4288)
MASPYIPDDAAWYLADLVEEIRVEGDPRSVVHINTVLVNAQSPEEAFTRACQLGQEAEQDYLNPSGRRVTFVFRGLRNLNVIHDPLEHGGELCFSERVGLSDAEIRGLVRDKDSLGVFCAPEPLDRPDYSCGEALQEALKIMQQRRDR